MDAVIADVPCSGYGIIRKKPDIRYKDPASMADLPQLQLQILKNQARYVKPGGTLMYSTCTLLPDENENQVREFLSTHPEFSIEEDASWLPETLRDQMKDGMIQLLPHRHEGMDGFFIARMRRAR